MILADDLFLLLLDDTGKQLVPTDSLNVALAGALLVDLAQSGRIGVRGRPRSRGSARIETLDAPTTGDEVLDGALEVVRRKQGKRATAMVTALTANRRTTVADRLVRAGVVDARDGRVLGVFPTHRWSVRHPQPTAALRSRLREVLSADVVTEERSRALIALLHAVGGLKKAVSVDGDVANWGAAKKRAKAMVDAQWSAQAVRAVIQASQAAAAAAGTGAMVAATGGS